MKKIFLTTAATILMTNIASADIFYPESQTFNYNVSTNNLIKDENNRNIILIKLSLPESATLWDKMNFCSTIHNESVSKNLITPTMMLSRDKTVSGPGFRPNGTDCYLAIPSNMGDSEYKITLSYKDTLRTYDIIYRDIDPIVTYSSNPYYALKNTYEVGEYIYMSIYKPYADLHIEGVDSLPKGIELIKNTPERWEVMGASQEAGNVNLKATDLNNDNKELSISFRINQKPAPEPEPEEPTKCRVSDIKVPEGQRIVFRYSMKRVDSDC